MANLVNLTPHTINIIVGEKSYEIPASGMIARVTVKQVADGEVNGIPVSKSVYSDIVGLPEPQEGTLYIVGALVGVNAHREDVIGPDTSRAIRNEAGQVIGVPGFVRY